MADAALSQYYWMTQAAIVFAFWMSFGIGANDVANSFATSVSAKSITLLQATLIASVCEFAGAMLLGASVTGTIRSGVIYMSFYENDPEVMMFGQLCALVTAAVVMQIANYCGAPVSTTHTIVGALVGFSIAAAGFESINWKTIIMIVVSWFASPIIAGIGSFCTFWTIRKYVLLSDHPYKRSILIYPVVLFVAIFIELFFILYKSGMNKPGILKTYGLKIILPIAAGSGLLVALIFQCFISPCLQKKIELEADGPVEAPVDEGEADVKEGVEEEEKPKNCAQKGMKIFLDNTFNRDLEAEAIAADENVQGMLDNAEIYDEKAEHMFSYLQVFSACMMSFSHGSNDVANAIAPLSAVFLIYETGSISSTAPVQTWALALGASGIVCGFALYGYKLIIALGYKLTKMSPSKGFSIELVSSFVVVIASFIGIPISTTQCQVGGTFGTGFVGKGEKEVNGWFFARCCVGWVLSFLGVLLLNCGVFAFCYYAPAAPGFATAS